MIHSFLLIHLVIHSLTESIDSFICWMIHSLSDSFIEWFIQWVSHQVIHSLSNSFIERFIQLSDSFNVQVFKWFIYWLIHSMNYSFLKCFIHWVIYFNETQSLFLKSFVRLNQLFFMCNVEGRKRYKGIFSVHCFQDLALQPNASSCLNRVLLYAITSELVIKALPGERL